MPSYAVTVLLQALTSSQGDPGLSINPSYESERSRHGNGCSVEAWDGLRLTQQLWL